MKRSNVKQQIIDTASKLFYANGYHSTGINEIIAKANIAKATLYHHFKSKEDICIAYLDIRHQTFMNKLEEFIEERPESRAKLLAIFDFLRLTYREDGFNGCWSLKTFGELNKNDQNIHAIILKQKNELLQFLESLAKELILNISKAEAEKISGGLFLLYESAITESNLHRNDWPIHLAKKLAPSFFSDSDLKN